MPRVRRASLERSTGSLTISDTAVLRLCPVKGQEHNGRHQHDHPPFEAPNLWHIDSCSWLGNNNTEPFLGHSSEDQADRLPVGRDWYAFCLHGTVRRDVKVKWRVYLWTRQWDGSPG